MIIVADGFAVGDETAGQLANFICHGLRQADDQSLFIDAFKLFVLFADQQMPPVEFFLRAIIVVAKQRLDFGLLHRIQQLGQNARCLFVGVLIRCAVRAFGVSLLG